MSKSKFEEIYRDLKYHVEQGDYLYSELLPSENNLIGIYDCSRNTIRRAIAGLVGDGYVQAVHGKGVQVIFQPSEKTNFTVGRIESFQETAARNRMTYCTKVVVYETITVDESRSRESSFPVGSEVLHICRVRSVDDKPLILDVNYFLKSAVPGLTKEIAENSIYAYLEQELKMQIVTSKRRITVEKATPQDRELIFMDSYNCLAVVTSNTFNSDGVMFEYTQSRHQPEYFSFHDTATRKKAATQQINASGFSSPEAFFVSIFHQIIPDVQTAGMAWSQHNRNDSEYLHPFGRKQQAVFCQCHHRNPARNVKISEQKTALRSRKWCR